MTDLHVDLVNTHPGNTNFDVKLESSKRRSAVTEEAVRFSPLLLHLSSFRQNQIWAEVGKHERIILVC